jgi:hypothetical protein
MGLPRGALAPCRQLGGHHNAAAAVPLETDEKSVGVGVGLHAVLD